MAANDLTPERVSEMAEEIAAELPPDPAGGFAGTVFDPFEGRSGVQPPLQVPDRSKGPPMVMEICLLDQYGNVVARAPFTGGLPTRPGETVTFPGITITL